MGRLARGTQGRRGMTRTERALAVGTLVVLAALAVSLIIGTVKGWQA